MLGEGNFDDRDGVVALEVGWDKEIRPKGIQVLEEYLSGTRALNEEKSLFSKVFSSSTSSFDSFFLICVSTVAAVHAYLHHVLQYVYPEDALQLVRGALPPPRTHLR